MADLPIQTIGGITVAGMVSAENYVAQYGKDGATVSMAVDGSGTPKNYIYTPPSTMRFCCYQINISIDDGILAFAPGDFGAIGGALTNGVTIRVSDDGTTYPSTHILHTFKTNREVLSAAGDRVFASFVVGSYMFGIPIISNQGGGLMLKAGGAIKAVVNDNLTGLTYMSVMFIGKLVA